MAAGIGAGCGAPVVGQAEAALAVAHERAAVERAQLERVEAHQVPVVVRRRIRVPELGDVPVDARLAVREPARAACPSIREAPGGLTPTSTELPGPRLSTSDVKPSRQPCGAPATTSPARRALVEVGQQLARPQCRMPCGLQAPVVALAGHVDDAVVNPREAAAGRPVGDVPVATAFPPTKIWPSRTTARRPSGA